MKLLQRLAIGYTQTKFKLLTLISKKKTAEQAFVLFSTPFLKSKKKADPEGSASKLRAEVRIRWPF